MLPPPLSRSFRTFRDFLEDCPVGFQFELDLNCKSLFLQSLACWNYCQCLLEMCFSVVPSVGSAFEVYNSMV